jgi:Protein of unknown function (DUF3892)
MHPEGLNMAVVTRARRESSALRTHEHIVGVCTASNTYYPRSDVLESIDRGEDWYTSDGRSAARIRKIAGCPEPGCSLRPYITTAPDHTPRNNLENLPPC